MNAAAFMRMSGLNTSLGCTMAKVSEPIETMLIPMMRCLASSPQTRNCSRSKPSKHGRSKVAAATDVWMGPDGSRPDDSATSVRRYRGTPYGVNVGLGVESRFGLTVSGS